MIDSRFIPNSPDASRIESVSGSRWTEIEKAKAYESIREFGKDFEKIAMHIGTRNKR